MALDATLFITGYYPKHVLKNDKSVSKSLILLWPIFHEQGVTIWVLQRWLS